MKALLIGLTLLTSMASFAGTVNKVINDKTCKLHVFSGFQGVYNVSTLRGEVISSLKKNGFDVIDHGASDKVFLDVNYDLFNDSNKLLLTENNHGCSSEYLGGGWEYWDCSQNLNFYKVEEGVQDLLVSANEKFESKPLVRNGLKLFMNKIKKQLPVCTKI